MTPAGHIEARLAGVVGGSVRVPAAGARERVGTRDGGFARAVAFAGPLLLIVLVSARIDGRSPASPHAHLFLAQELVLVLGAAAFAAAAAWMRLRVRRDSVTLGVVALAALEVASAASSADAWLALRSATVWGSGLAVLVVARSLGRDARDLGLSAILLPVGLVAGSVIVEALGLARFSASHHAPGGLLGERNVASELLVCGAPLVAYVVLTAHSSWGRRGALCLSVVATAAIVLTRTRSAWLAGIVLVAALTFAALRRRVDPNRTRRVRCLLGASILGVALALALPTTLRWRSAHPYRDSLVHLVDPVTSSGGGRLVQYGTTLRMAGAHPGLGVGPGNWAGTYLSFAHQGDRTVHEGLTPVNRLPNSDLLGFAAERGLGALVALVGLGILLVRQGGPNSELRTLRRATLLAVAITASLDAVLQTPAALLLVAWVVGLSSQRSAEPERSTRSAGGVPSDVLHRSTFQRRPAESLAFAFAAFGLLVVSVPAARRVVSVGVAAHARGSDDFERAAALDPGDIGLRLVAAESWITEGRCDRARRHLDAVARFSPASPARRELAARCPGASSP
jgi:O-antigen ligase